MSYGRATYKDALSQLVLTTLVFNSGMNNCSRAFLPRYLEKISFYLLLLLLTITATLAVFQTPGIDTWIRFSLYVVPLFSIVYGHLIFKSQTFRKILQRNLHEGLWQTKENDRSETYYSSNEIWFFLRKQSLKTCFYPLSLVIYQWSAFMIFFYFSGNRSYSGEIILAKLYLPTKKWFPMYCTFWTIGMYLTGFVGFSFIAVVKILKLDVENFLHQLGIGPFTQHGQIYNARSDQNFQQLEENTRVEKPISTGSLPYRLISITIGFLTLDVIDLIPEPLFSATSEACLVYEYTPEGDTPRENGITDSGMTEERWHSQIAVSHENGPGDEAGHHASRQKMSPKEASEHLICLIKNIENNSLLFQPFLVLLAFFSIVSLVTHVVAMVTNRINGFMAMTHWWTLVRTLIWFLLAVRLLWTAAKISKALSSIMPHIYYLRSVGKLPGTNGEWKNFIQLAKTFKLGYQPYAFPLTLSQVASIVAVINFSFLIVISVIPNNIMT